ncbi:MAG: hypothetical protein K2I22_10430 [Lachnospiraceae bacterium]|nr:hypothetical protein [Lachnospiraceae bacterium]
MQEYRKINQIAGRLRDYWKNPLYEELKEPFRYFLNADPGGIWPYIKDKNADEELEAVKTRYMDAVTLFIGGKGNGKTIEIMNVFGCVNNAIQIDGRAVIIPVFKHSAALSNGGIDEIRYDISRTAGAVCGKIESEFTDVKEWFEKKETKENFEDFVWNTNPKVLYSLGNRDGGTTENKLNAAKEEFFIYEASKLKFYLSKADVPLDRVIIIIDGIESVREEVRKNIVMQYIRFFECMQNYPKGWNGRRVHVQLVISMRTETDEVFRQDKAFDGLETAVIIQKKRDIDLSLYFREKYNALPDNVKYSEDGKWEKALKILLLLSEKYEKKYADIIKGLTGHDMRQVMRIYNDILSNPVWVTRDALTDPSVALGKDEYVLNNITVERSIACGADLVYMGGTDGYIPSIFDSRVEENEKGASDNALMTLYIMAYNIRLLDIQGRDENKPVKLRDMQRDFRDIFGDTFGERDDIYKLLNDAVHHLVACGVLEMKDNGESIKFASKGVELWKLMARDSVVLEMYREDMYMVFDKGNPDAFKSSYELMRENKQALIFEYLINILRDLFKREEKIINRAKSAWAFDNYESLFGKVSMTGHLLEGVGASMDFSGKADSDTEEARKNLSEAITNLFK